MLHDKVDTQTLTLILAAINTMVLPAIAGIGRYMWRLEKRLLRIQMHVNMGIEE